MKKSFIFGLLCLMPFLAKSQYTLSGTIVEQSSQEPLPGAHILLTDSRNATVSDKDGMFVFESLPAGTYALSVSYLGYETLEIEVELREVTFLRLELRAEAFLSEEVIVRAGRAGLNSPITYSSLDRETLQANQTAADLPYLLRNTPSVVVTSDAGAGTGYTHIRVRGSDLTRINVTMNGIPVNDPESHGVFFVNMPDLVNSIDNMQIQRGVGSSVNGAAAFGASINIKTDAPSEKAFAELQSGFGSFNTFRNSLRFGTGRSNKGFALDGRLSAISSDGYIERGWSDLKSFYLAASWSDEFSLLKFMMTGGKEQTYQAWYGIPKDSLQTNRRYNPSGEMLDADGNITGYYDNQTDNYQQDYYQLHAAHRFSPYFFVNISAFLTNGRGYYESWRNDERLSRYGLAPVIIDSLEITSSDLIRQKWLDNQFYGFNAALHYQMNKGDIVAGGGWNMYEGDHFGHIAWAQFASESTPDWRYYDNTGFKRDYSIFVRASRQIIQELNLYADLQYRNIDYEIAGIHDDLRDISQHHRFSFFNPKAGLHYNLNAKNSVYFSVGVANREPNRSVYRDADESQDISSERLLNYELGHKLQGTNFVVESNLYYMDYTDQLVLTGEINNVGAAILTNVDKSYRAGLEVSLDYALHADLTLSGNASFSMNKILGFTEYVDNWDYWIDPENEPVQYVIDHGTTDISFSPDIIASAQLKYTPLPSLGMRIQTKYIGRQFIDNTSTVERSLDPYWLSHLNFDYDVPVKWFDQFKLRLQLNNIFNHSYTGNAWVYRYYAGGEAQQMEGYFPQAGFHWMAGMQIGF